MAADFVVTTSAVLAHRAAVQDLVAPRGDAAESPLLTIGIQDTPAGSALSALRVRSTDDTGPDGPLALVAAMRGAPHLIRRDCVPVVAAALDSLDEHPDDVREVADAMRTLVGDGSMSKPDLSAALTPAVPRRMRTWCERCAVHHVPEDLFRSGTRRAGLEIDPREQRPIVFRRRPDAAECTDPHPLATVILQFVRCVGVVRRADVAAWLGCRSGELDAVWPTVLDGLIEGSVSCGHSAGSAPVEGHRHWAAADSPIDGDRERVDTVLPPSDPFLWGERDLVVPDREHRRTVFRPVGSPGVILVGGTVSGTWRISTTSRSTRIRVSAFAPVPKAVRGRLEAGAHRIARTAEIEMTYE